MLFVYIVLTTSMVPTCAPNKHMGNARENRKGLLPNNRKGYNNTSHSWQNLFKIKKITYFKLQKNCKN